MVSPRRGMPVLSTPKWRDWAFPAARGVGNPGQQPGFAPLAGGTIPRATLSKSAIQGMAWDEHLNHDVFRPHAGIHPWTGGPHVHIYAPTAPGVGADTIRLRFTYQVNPELGVVGAEVPEELDFVITHIGGHRFEFARMPQALFQIGSQFAILVQRLGNAGSDTYDDIIMLHEFDIHVLADSFGTNEEYPPA